MGKVKLIKSYYPENITILNNGLTIKTSNGYGQATTSLAIKKYTKKPVYIEAMLTTFSGICLGMVFTGKSSNWFEVNSFPRVSQYYQSEVVNGSRTDEATSYPSLASGHVLGIVLSPLHNWISLYANGRLYKQYNAKRVNSSKIDGDEVYFLIGVGGGLTQASEFTVNFGATPVKYLIPEGCISYEKAVSYYDKNLLYIKGDAVYGVGKL